MAAGSMFTIGGSLKGFSGIDRLGEVMAFGGFLLFLVARGAANSGGVVRSR